MGRKGVSKRKTSQAKTKPLSREAVKNSVSSAVKAGERQPAKVADVDKTILSKKSEGKPATDWKKKSRKE
jgi:hypothetical protein